MMIYIISPRLIVYYLCYHILFLRNMYILYEFQSRILSMNSKSRFGYSCINLLMRLCGKLQMKNNAEEKFLNCE
jgi:hypothetical protein